MRAFHASPLATLALLAGCLFSSGCLTDDQWSFPVTRHILEEGLPPQAAGTSNHVGHVQRPEVAAVIVALPVAVDLAILPVTLPRDLYHWVWLRDV